MKSANNPVNWEDAREIWEHDFNNGDNEERLTQLGKRASNRLEKLSNQVLSHVVTDEMLEEVLRTKNVMVFINNLRANYQFFYDETPSDDLLWKAAEKALKIQEKNTQVDHPVSVAVMRRKISSDLKEMADTDNEEEVRVLQVADKMFEYSLAETAAAEIEVDEKLEPIFHENILGRIRNIRRAGLHPIFKERLGRYTKN